MAYVPTAAGAAEILDGAIWRKCHPGTAFRWTPTAGTASSTDTFTDGTITTTGLPGNGEISFDILPNDAAQYFRLLTQAAAAGTPVTIRNDAGKAVAELAEGGTNNTLAVAPISGRAGWGTLTAAGTSAQDFGSEASPKTPWNQGLVVVMGSVAFVVERILTSTTAEVRRFGAVTNKIASPDAAATAITAQSATTSWKLVAPIFRRQYVGTPSLPPGIDTSATDRTSTATVTLSAAPSLSLVVEV